MICPRILAERATPHGKCNFRLRQIWQLAVGGEQTCESEMKEQEEALSGGSASTSKQPRLSDTITSSSLRVRWYHALHEFRQNVTKSAGTTAIAPADAPQQAAAGEKNNVVARTPEQTVVPKELRTSRGSAPLAETATRMISGEDSTSFVVGPHQREKTTPAAPHLQCEDRQKTILHHDDPAHHHDHHSTPVDCSKSHAKNEIPTCVSWIRHALVEIPEEKDCKLDASLLAEAYQALSPFAEEFMGGSAEKHHDNRLKNEYTIIDAIIRRNDVDYAYWIEQLTEAVDRNASVAVALVMLKIYPLPHVLSQMVSQDDQFLLSDLATAWEEAVLRLPAKRALELLDLVREELQQAAQQLCLMQDVETEQEHDESEFRSTSPLGSSPRTVAPSTTRATRGNDERDHGVALVTVLDEEQHLLHHDEDLLLGAASNQYQLDQELRRQCAADELSEAFLYNTFSHEFLCDFEQLREQVFLKEQKRRQKAKAFSFSRHGGAEFFLQVERERLQKAFADAELALTREEQELAPSHGEEKNWNCSHRTNHFPSRGVQRTSSGLQSNISGEQEQLESTFQRFSGTTTSFISDEEQEDCGCAHPLISRSCSTRTTTCTEAAEVGPLETQSAEWPGRGPLPPATSRFLRLPPEVPVIPVFGLQDVDKHLQEGQRYTFGLKCKWQKFSECSNEQVGFSPCSSCSSQAARTSGKGGASTTTSAPPPDDHRHDCEHHLPAGSLVLLAVAEKVFLIDLVPLRARYLTRSCYVTAKEPGETVIDYKEQARRLDRAFSNYALDLVRSISEKYAEKIVAFGTEEFSRLGLSVDDHHGGDAEEQVELSCRDEAGKINPVGGGLRRNLTPGDELENKSRKTKKSKSYHLAELINLQTVPAPQNYNPGDAESDYSDCSTNAKKFCVPSASTQKLEFASSTQPNEEPALKMFTPTTKEEDHSASCWTSMTELCEVVYKGFQLNRQLECSPWAFLPRPLPELYQRYAALDAYLVLGCYNALINAVSSTGVRVQNMLFFAATTSSQEQKMSTQAQDVDKYAGCSTAGQCGDCGGGGGKEEDEDPPLGKYSNRELLFSPFQYSTDAAAAPMIEISPNVFPDVVPHLRKTYS
ncbi:unnamed protein product [Amoebophrya sp. A120]|nr:unnamed protein product [Amoebophrya sp. A120]|eukprot:GSA120T00025131001.1